MALNEVMAALSDETRRQILEILRKGRPTQVTLPDDWDDAASFVYHLRKLKLI